MITKFNKFLIKESPDTVYRENERELKYYDPDSKPFFFEVNSNHTEVENVFIGKFGTAHSSIPIDSGRYKSSNSDYNDYDEDDEDWDDRAYAGRLWLGSKIIAFWVYPNEGLFKKIIKAIENELNIKIFNNDWKIEVMINDDEEIRKRNFGSGEGEDYYFGTRDSRDEYKEDIIPVEEYVGSENVPEEQQIMHLMNWKEKELAIKAGKYHFKNFGSYKTGWDQPHNIKYRQAIYQEKKNNK